MFSRTTMASSINSPTASDSAIRLIMLMVTPEMSMKKKVAIIAIGKVRPVMMVERHELRNRNTIKIVRPAPSIMVRRTLSTPVRICVDASRITSTLTPAGSSRCSATTAALTPSATSIVFCPCALMMSSAMMRPPSLSARLSCSCWPSITVATSRSVIAWPPRRATMMRLKSSIEPILPLICTTCSRSCERMLPAGNSWFSLRIAFITCSTPTFRAWSSTGFNNTCTSRLTPPTIVTEPTPRTFSMRFFTSWSDKVVRSRTLRVDCGVDGAVGCEADCELAGGATAATLSEIIGRSAGSKREIFGSLTSLRNPTLTMAIFSRTSCAALAGSIVRSNSTITTDCPSYERDDIVLMPDTVLTASSTGRVMSVSTDSGEAPGYSVVTTTTGKLMSGNWSTRRR